jgi:hypothetical protein
MNLTCTLPRPASLLWLSFLLFSLTFPAESRAQLANPAPSSNTEAGLPSAQEVVAKFVKAIGGKAAFDKIKSQHIKGKFEMAGQGITGDLEVFAKQPDKLLIKITLPGVGELAQGFDGKVGWSVNPITGPMVLEGKMLDQSREQAQFDSVLHDASQFKSMETTGRTQFEGKECYQLKLVRKSGQEVTEFYDTQTGLLIGSSEVQETPLGSVNATGIVSDYRKFGEALFATKLTQKMGPLAQVMSFHSIEFNTVDESAFGLPDPIKTLLKK